MSQELMRFLEVVEKASVAAPMEMPVRGKEVVPLEQVLRQVRVDAAALPGEYLAETRVPFGGE